MCDDQHMKRLPAVAMLLCAATFAAAAGTTSPSKAARGGGVCSADSPFAGTGPQTSVYVGARRVGCVRRSSGRLWDAQEGACGWVEKRTTRALYAGEGFRAHGVGRLATGNVWRVSAAGSSRSLGAVRRGASATRWEIYKGNRRIAYTKGPDGPAAGVAFLVLYDCYTR